MHQNEEQAAARFASCSGNRGENFGRGESVLGGGQRRVGAARVAAPAAGPGDSEQFAGEGASVGAMAETRDAPSRRHKNGGLAGGCCCAPVAVVPLRTNSLLPNEPLWHA